MLFLSSQMIKEAEAEAMKNISSVQLIKNAAYACANQLREFASVRIYCGKGNNGADGYATAVILKSMGKEVEAVCVLEPSSEECVFFCSEAQKAGVAVVPLSFPSNRFDCAVDAIFGIGISGAVTGDAQKATEMINTSGSFVVSVDIPSGMNADTGTYETVCVKADKTITFTAPKRGMLYNESVNNCGEIVIAEVGIPVDYTSINQSSCVPITQKLAKSLMIPRERLSHKGTFGTTVIVAGSYAMAGAAAMAGLAAYRAGCGMVKIIAPGSICHILNILIKEAVVIPAPEQNGVILPTLNERETDALKRADSVLIGCGLGKGEHQLLIENILSVTSTGVIIDADGINALQGNLNIIRNKNVLLTPHPLEFSRISGLSVEECEKHRIGYADKFAREYGVSLMLKGARTVICYGGSNKYVSLISTSALAKAGSGDILAGITASIAAQGCSLTDSAAAGCYIHSLAGLIAEKEIGAYGVMADDIISLIPRAVKMVTNS